MADILALLIEERDRLNEAITVLGGPRRRGRPRADAKKANNPAATAKPGRKMMSPTQRKAVSERMKKSWAKRRRAAKKQAAAG